MKLSSKQRIDLKTLSKFSVMDAGISESDIEAYFAWSDRGVQPTMTKGVLSLKKAKTIREAIITDWQNDKDVYLFKSDFADEEDWYQEWVNKVLGW